MGLSLSWLAVKGRPPQAVRDALEFQSTGQFQDFPESKFSGVEMPNGWYLIFAQRKERVAPDSMLRQLSDSGGELVTCFVEEHVMVSHAAGWRNGHRIWSVLHNSEKDLRHLEVRGEPPEGFSAVRDEWIGKYTGVDDCDYTFDIPAETARLLTGYRHDEDVPGLSGDVFEVLTRTKKPSFFGRLFGK